MEEKDIIILEENAVCCMQTFRFIYRRKMKICLFPHSY